MTLPLVLPCPQSEPVGNSSTRHEIREISGIPGHQRKAVNSGTGPNSRIGQFDPMRTAERNGFFPNLGVAFDQTEAVWKTPSAGLRFGCGSQKDFDPTDDADVFFAVEARSSRASAASLR